MTLSRLLAAGATITIAMIVVTPAAHGQGEPTQAVRLCQNLTLYAGSLEPGGLWRDVRVEDARGARAAYTAATARVGEFQGAPAVLLTEGSVEMTEPDGRPRALAFEEFVIASCPEAAEHSAN